MGVERSGPRHSGRTGLGLHPILPWKGRQISNVFARSSSPRGRCCLAFLLDPEHAWPRSTSNASNPLWAKCRHRGAMEPQRAAEPAPTGPSSPSRREAPTTKPWPQPMAGHSRRGQASWPGRYARCDRRGREPPVSRWGTMLPAREEGYARRAGVHDRASTPTRSARPAWRSPGDLIGRRAQRNHLRLMRLLRRHILRGCSRTAIARRPRWPPRYIVPPLLPPTPMAPTTCPSMTSRRPPGRVVRRPSARRGGAHDQASTATSDPPGDSTDAEHRPVRPGADIAKPTPSTSAPGGCWLESERVPSTSAFGITPYSAAAVVREAIAEFADFDQHHLARVS